MRCHWTILTSVALTVGAGFILGAYPGPAQEDPADSQEKSTEDLAKAAQNPVANMISLPFQSNTNFGVGPFHAPQEVFNIQPVMPISTATIGT